MLSIRIKMVLNQCLTATHPIIIRDLIKLIFRLLTDYEKY